MITINLDYIAPEDISDEVAYYLVKAVNSLLDALEMQYFAFTKTLYEPSALFCNAQHCVINAIFENIAPSEIAHEVAYYFVDIIFKFQAMLEIHYYSQIEEHESNRR